MDFSSRSPGFPFVFGTIYDILFCAVQPKTFFFKLTCEKILKYYGFYFFGVFGRADKKARLNLFEKI